MPNKTLRIVFLGTPEFAACSLNVLVEEGFNIVAVITAPDRPKGRGRKLQPSAVKTLAENHKIPVLQPTNLKGDTFLASLRSYHADVQIVVAFRMLPEVVWNLPPMGTYNLHASLLPNYRGAAPINWAIMNGETQTGVTTFKLTHAIDTGHILLRKEVPILASDNAGTLHDRLMKEGADLMVATVRMLATGETPDLLPQTPGKQIKQAPKLFKEDMRIDWHRSAEMLHHFIRGLAPNPGAWTLFQGQVLKIYSAEKADPTHVSHDLKPGDYHRADDQLYVKTSDGWLLLKELQLAGKRRMDVATFLRGHQSSEAFH